MTIGQILLFTLFAGLKKMDQKGPQISNFNSMFWGAMVGLCLGDFKTGLIIGGTYQLMSLGVAAIGGSSVPDYQIGAIITSAVAISSGAGMEAGMAVGLPICMLAVQFDVIGNIIHGQFIREARKCCHEKKFKQMDAWILACCNYCFNYNDSYIFRISVRKCSGRIYFECCSWMVYQWSDSGRKDSSTLWIGNVNSVYASEKIF